MEDNVESLFSLMLLVSTNRHARTECLNVVHLVWPGMHTLGLTAFITINFSESYDHRTMKSTLTISDPTA